MWVHAFVFLEEIKGNCILPLERENGMGKKEKRFSLFILYFPIFTLYIFFFNFQKHLACNCLLSNYGLLGLNASFNICSGLNNRTLLSLSPFKWARRKWGILSRRHWGGAHCRKKRLRCHFSGVSMRTFAGPQTWPRSLGDPEASTYQ